jgi:hypothetical protein
VTSCTSATDVCIVRLTNTGTSNAAATSCTIQNGGKAVASTLTGAPLTVPASGAVSATCTATVVAAQTVGSMAVGSFSMSNGASVPFSGTWQ